MRLNTYMMHPVPVYVRTYTCHVDGGLISTEICAIHDQRARICVMTQMIRVLYTYRVVSGARAAYTYIYIHIHIWYTCMCMCFTHIHTHIYMVCTFTVVDGMHAYVWTIAS